MTISESDSSPSQDMGRSRSFAWLSYWAPLDERCFLFRIFTCKVRFVICLLQINVFVYQFSVTFLELKTFLSFNLSYQYLIAQIIFWASYFFYSNFDKLGETLTNWGITPSHCLKFVSDVTEIKIVKGKVIWKKFTSYWCCVKSILEISASVESSSCDTEDTLMRTPLELYENWPGN